MQNNITNEQLEQIVGGTTTNNEEETIHEGDVFKNTLFVYIVVRLVSYAKDRDFDVFECKYWDSYGNYRGGRDYTCIENKYRCDLNSYERLK